MVQQSGNVDEQFIVSLVHDQSHSTRLNFMRLVFENLSDAAYWIRENGQILQVNNAACQMLGFSEDEFLTRHMYDLNPEVAGRAGWDRAWSLLKEHQKRTFQTSHRTKDGRDIPVEVTATFVRFEGEEYSCAFARDVSDRMQMDLRLRQAEKMEAIGRLAGGVAHDFNNQLAVILGNAEILSDATAGDRKRSELIGSILQSARRSADLTAQLLAFARQGSYVETQVDLHEIVQETCGMLTHGNDRRISIECELQANYSFVAGDATQLQSAVLNLAINARDSMPNGGRLVFATQNVHLDEPFQVRHGLKASAGEHIILRITDTGYGMSEVTQERLFEPFFTTKEAGKGTGLGLAAVYGTVKQHRGAILVESQVGQGSSFHVYLPALLVSGGRRPEPVPIADHQFRGLRVLLVEDEPQVRAVSIRMLVNMGCIVTAFENGPQAIAYFRQAASDIDLVVLDMVMPDLDGRETFLQMQEIHPDMRAILASGFSVDGVAQSMLESGVAGYLQKPYSREALARKIAKVLAQA